ncbi:hypothetical protein POM88_007913 [Heracleum sosnowskyi]|uniref:Uncharacterized protein n=1 Tax=Heracleum sosnowskyi TaxID=360622 RepID=A0AAD8J8Z0_9APIA|nr:hypothetical protein POM88_007913 [Heracleum sosnowskyi]
MLNWEIISKLTSSFSVCYLLHPDFTFFSIFFHHSNFSIVELHFNSIAIISSKLATQANFAAKEKEAIKERPSHWGREKTPQRGSLAGSKAFGESAILLHIFGGFLHLFSCVCSPT